MGCDIHCYIEYKMFREKGWRTLGSCINPGRCYSTFERLAGVRGDSGRAIVRPRGIPSDLGSWAYQDYWLIIKDEYSNSRGFCSITSAESYYKYGSEYERDQNGKPIKVSHPDWHSHSWLTALEWTEATKEAPIAYQAIAAMLRYLDQVATTRIVFWFDN